MAVQLLTAPGRRRGPTAELLVLAAPIVLLTVSRLAMGFIDFVMVSQLGTAAQAAISPASLLVFAVACLGVGVANGVQTFVAQACGRGEPQQAGAWAWQSLYIAAAFAVLTVPVAAATEHWFGGIAALGRHTDEVRGLETAYLRIALWSIAPMILSTGLDGLFNGVQRPTVALIAVLASLVTNLVGNWLLIFGNLGLPRLGIAGAACATVIGWWVRVAVLVAASLLGAFDQRFRTRRALAPDRRKLLALVRVGGPTAVGWLVDIGSWAVFMILIMPPYGTTAMAATNVGLQLMHLSFMPAIGIGIALCSQVGFAIGQRRPDEADMRTRIAFRVTAAYMGLIGLLFWIAPQPLVRLFNSDPAVVAAGTVVLLWAGVFQVFDAMGITFVSALRGAGDTRFPALLMGLTCWVVFIGGGVTVTRVLPGLGLSGPWAMCALYVVIVGAALAWRWRGGRWRRIRLFEEESPAVAVPAAAAAAARSAAAAPGGAAPAPAAAAPGGPAE